ncbi:MAG TPA: helix-turn-helix domain-containing protein [Puia sp.]|jgi:YesN/AraC family two-component response regulator|nr:helix-turn-helix domain-containing protein [Puia sp.]
MKNKLLSFLKAVFGHKKIRVDGRQQDYAATDYIQHRLDLYMVEMRPFLQPHYTIKQLAGAIRIPSYQLSAIINQRKGMNFTDYLNKLRIQYCEDLIRIEGGKKINLGQLASRCGFRNRNTFVHAFRKFTGLTPSEYVRQMP